MITLVGITKQGAGEVVATLFADTKTEVPNTGVATKALLNDSVNGKLVAPTVIYTAALDIAILKSDDTWQWN